MHVQDNPFFKVFAVVFGALVLFTLTVLMIAKGISPTSDTSADPLVQAQLLERIRPVGESRLE